MHQQEAQLQEADVEWTIKISHLECLFH
jgi:hypothetical protein